VRLGFGLWCLTPRLTIFKLFRRSVLLEKSTDMLHVTVNNLSHNVVWSTPRMGRDLNSQL
jgi:hypothetical protein